MGHPIFSKFNGFEGWVDEGFFTDYLGAMTNSDFAPGSVPEKAHRVKAVEPAPGEEYFQWIDLLESVALAGDVYSMVEVGAGYGRWAVRAAMAALQLSDRPFHLVAIEAEPQHFEWLCQHFRDNDLDPGQHRLIEAAVTDHRAGVIFYVGNTTDDGFSPRQWYGQEITPEYERRLPQEGEEEYHLGRSLVRHESGMKSVRAQSVTLEDAILDLALVDLIDMDIQGQELKVVRASLPVLNEKVRRLHIGTHNAEVERGIRETLGGAGWKCLTDYPCMQEADTPYGRIWFHDGVQSWVNVKL